MSKSIFAKVAAVACSVAALGALGIAASAQTDEPIDQSKLTAGKVNIVAGIVKADKGETVTFPVYVYNNKEPGFAATGIRLFHDAELKPVFKTNGKPDAKLGEVALDPVLSSSWDYNEAERLIALGTMGDEATPNNGVWYTAKVTVPENPTKAKFPMTLEVDKFLDAATNPVDYVTVDGYIYIDDIVTTAPTTAPTAAPTTSNTAAVTTTSAKQNAVTTTSAKAGAAVTTTKAGTSSSTTATKTGDAGVGVAVAGLLLAAGTAVVATKKKKD